LTPCLFILVYIFNNGMHQPKFTWKPTCISACLSVGIHTPHMRSFVYALEQYASYENKTRSCITQITFVWITYLVVPLMFEIICGTFYVKETKLP
jgi:hypothetical protein